MPEIPDPLVAIENVFPEWNTRLPVPLRRATGVGVFDGLLRPAFETIRFAPTSEPNPISGAPSLFRQVHHPDYRQGGWANMFAYAAAVRDFDPVLELIGFFRAQLYPYDRPVGLKDLGKLADVVGASLMFVNWLVLKSDNPMKNGEVPTEIAGMTRVGTGLEKMLGDLGASGRLKFVLPIKEGELTSELLLETIFENRQLHRYSMEEGADINALPTGDAFLVCPADKERIERSIRVLFEPLAGSGDVLQRLGIELSSEDIIRVKKLGQARETDQVEELVLEDVKGELEDRMDNHSRALIPAIEQGIRIDQTPYIKKVQKAYESGLASIRKLQNAQHLVDQSLRREKGPRIKPEEYGIDLDFVQRLYKFSAR